MHIKKYTAPSMREALLKIKEELGENAIILKSRKLPKKLFTVGEQDEVEVTAALDGDAPGLPFAPLVSSRSTGGTTGAYPRPRSSATLPSGMAELVALKNRNAAVTQKVFSVDSPAVPFKLSAPTPNADALRLLEIKDDIRELKDMLKSILATGTTAASGEFSGGWAVLYKRLIDAEVRPDIASALITTIKNGKESPDADINKKFISVLSDNFPVGGPLRTKKDAPLVLCFVGPTGSGKTTTLAKLAAYCSLSRNQRVSIITADTYRIAAIEQIRTFADIVHIGLQVIFSPSEAADALVACENDDIIFIDTAGRSHKNSEHIRELQEFLAVLKPDEIHCVLSATTKESDLMDNINRYRDLGANRLLFTKLDETNRLGPVFNSVYQTRMPVSYFTLGQSVPDDIEQAQPGRFASYLWEGSLV